MKPSAYCIEMVAGFEGLSTVAYQDGAGIWTLGYGHTGGVRAGDTCTREEALQWLSEDVGEAADAVNRYVMAPLTQNQFDALVSFTYNLGAGRLQHSTLLRKVNAGDTLAAAQFLVWDMVAGQSSHGLLRRRMAERDLFMKTEEPCTTGNQQQAAS